jgi:hypothetical protein
MKTIHIRIPSSMFALIAWSMLFMIVAVEQTPVVGCQTDQPQQTPTTADRTTADRTTADQATTQPVDAQRVQSSDETETQRKSDGSVKILPTAVSQANADTVEEIMAIRKQLGGGISSQLEGIQFPGDPANETDSVDGIARRAVEAQVRSSENFRGTTSNPLQPKNERFPTPDFYGANQNAAVSSNRDRYRSFVEQVTQGQPAFGQHPASRQYQTPMPQTPIPFSTSTRNWADGRTAASNSIPPVSELTGRIRSAAHSLEKAAAELESTGLYDEADQIRETARTLWRRARQ